MNIKDRLIEICGAENVCADEPLNRHTSFRTGGPADVFVTPKTEEDLVQALEFCKEQEIRHFILGNGTNVLAADEGYRGVVIQIYRSFSDITITGEEVCAGAGILLSALSAECARHSLTGFEFASGIPGTLGGAVTMNAGAYGGEMKDVLVNVRVLDRQNGIRCLTKEECALGYRTSIIKKEDYIVLGAALHLEKGDPEKIEARILELKEARTSKQPLEFPSAGSTFKRPEGYFAGKLIQDSGLAGYSIGGAQVSEKHCGFIINKGGATSADIKNLMQYVADTVKEKFGVALEKEVRFMEEES